MARINEAIREREVRLIDEKGEHSGIVPIEEALRKAQAANLDLVEVSNKSKPHVCRVMDYGQYKYELAKKQKEAKKKQKQIVVKEIKMRPRIDQHDYDFKLNHALKFLEHGDKVKIIMQFRGREMAHKDLGRVVMDRVIADLNHLALVEQEPRIEGRFMNMTLSPLPAAQRKKKEGHRPISETGPAEPLPEDLPVDLEGDEEADGGGFDLDESVIVESTWDEDPSDNE
ncbi:MAG: translation initiation factor IF-3 [bacterium]